jgi:DNA-binding NarL/FixJ family response regulator
VSEKVKFALVVEDQAETRLWLMSVLRSAFGEIDVKGFPDLGGIRSWLQAHPEATDGSRGRMVVLVDLALPDGSGVSLIKHLTDFDSVVPVVVSIYDDDAYLFDAMAAGAQGYLLKDQQPDSLVRRLMEIEKGEPPLSPSIARRMLAHFQADKAVDETPAVPEAALTTRETEVLGLLARGLRISDAAAELGLTRHTVAGYVKIIYSKLNISSRAEAALEAKRRGLI